MSLKSPDPKSSDCDFDLAASLSGVSSYGGASTIARLISGRAERDTGQMRDARKILMLLHREQSTPARVGRLLRMRGFGLDLRRLACGDDLPASLGEYHGVVVFGGPMSCYDPEPWIARECAFVEAVLKADLPLLGICLGAQMLARQLGAKVSCHPLGRAEIGYYPIEPTLVGDGMCAVPFPRMVYQWHRDGFDLPKSAVLLAHGRGDFPVQAFGYGAKAVGLQFHPEVTYAQMCRWTVSGHERLKLPGAQSRERHLSGWFAHDGPVARWLGAFLDAWLAQKLNLPCQVKARLPQAAMG